MQTKSDSSIELLDYCPETDSFLEEVVEGLKKLHKSLPSKFFYDERGSQLFDEICELPEYYPTRTEIAIMQSYIEQIVACIGPQALLVEFGSGSSLKTRVLLDALHDPAGYVPIDISKKHLLQAAQALAAIFPDLHIVPVCADYTTRISLPSIDAENTVVFFPGSTIGNFEPAGALDFLERMRRFVGNGGGVLIGVDLKKDIAIIEAAYNDTRGVTAAFNKNVLRRINRELSAEIDVDAFTHVAFYNAEYGRIEMHLRSLSDQYLTIGDERILIANGEAIRTEYSYKYSLSDFATLAGQAGFDIVQVWTDAQRLFSVQYLKAC